MDLLQIIALIIKLFNDAANFYTSLQVLEPALRDMQLMIKDMKSMIIDNGSKLIDYIFAVVSLSVVIVILVSAASLVVSMINLLSKKLLANYSNNAAYDNAAYDNAAYDNAAYDNAAYDNAAYDNAAYDMPDHSFMAMNVGKTLDNIAQEKIYKFLVATNHVQEDKNIDDVLDEDAANLMSMLGAESSVSLANSEEDVPQVIVLRNEEFMAVSLENIKQTLLEYTIALLMRDLIKGNAKQNPTLRAI